MEDVRRHLSKAKIVHTKSSSRIGRQQSYHADSRCGDRPANLPPEARIVTYHVPYAIIKSIHTERPRHRDALEEHQEEQAESADGVCVQQLEHVHPTLGFNSLNVNPEGQINRVQEEHERVRLFPVYSPLWRTATRPGRRSSIRSRWTVPSASGAAAATRPQRQWQSPPSCRTETRHTLIVQH